MVCTIYKIHFQIIMENINTEVQIDSYRKLDWWTFISYIYSTDYLLVGLLALGSPRPGAAVVGLDDEGVLLL